MSVLTVVANWPNITANLSHGNKPEIICYFQRKSSQEIFDIGTRDLMDINYSACYLLQHINAEEYIYIYIYMVYSRK